MRYFLGDDKWTVSQVIQEEAETQPQQPMTVFSPGGVTPITQYKTKNQAMLIAVQKQPDRREEQSQFMDIIHDCKMPLAIRKHAAQKLSLALRRKVPLPNCPERAAPPVAREPVPQAVQRVRAKQEARRIVAKVEAQTIKDRIAKAVAKSMEAQRERIRSLTHQQVAEVPKEPSGPVPMAMQVMAPGATAAPVEQPMGTSRWTPQELADLARARQVANSVGMKVGCTDAAQAAYSALVNAQLKTLRVHKWRWAPGWTQHSAVMVWPKRLTSKSGVVLDQWWANRFGQCYPRGQRPGGTPYRGTYRKPLWGD